jgi:hypothetical protein
MCDNSGTLRPASAWLFLAATCQKSIVFKLDIATVQSSLANDVTESDARAQ